MCLNIHKLQLERIRNRVLSGNSERVQDRREVGVGGVGGPGPAKIASYEKIEHNFEIDYFVFFHYSQKPLYSICFRKNKVYLVFLELEDYGTLAIKTVLGVSDTYWGPVL